MRLTCEDWTALWYDMQAFIDKKWYKKAWNILNRTVFKASSHSKIKIYYWTWKRLCYCWKFWYYKDLIWADELSHYKKCCSKEEYS